MWHPVELTHASERQRQRDQLPNHALLDQAQRLRRRWPGVCAGLCRWTARPAHAGPRHKAHQISAAYPSRRPGTRFWPAHWGWSQLSAANRYASASYAADYAHGSGPHPGKRARRSSNDHPALRCSAGGPSSSITACLAR